MSCTVATVVLVSQLLSNQCHLHRVRYAVKNEECVCVSLGNGYHFRKLCTLFRPATADYIPIEGKNSLVHPKWQEFDTEGTAAEIASTVESRPSALSTLGTLFTSLAAITTICAELLSIYDHELRFRGSVSSTICYCELNLWRHVQPVGFSSPRTTTLSVCAFMASRPRCVRTETSFAIHSRT